MHIRRNAEYPSHTEMSCLRWLSNIAHRRQIDLPQVPHCILAKSGVQISVCVSVCVCGGGGGQVMDRTTQFCLIAQ